MAAVHAAKHAVLSAAGQGFAYHKNDKIGVLAARVVAQTGEHGSVFELGEHIDVDLITIFIIAMIVFTIGFEVSIHKLEHYLSSNPVYLEALLKVFKELTIMGFISFILLLIHEFVHIPFHEHLVFEFAHVWIFFVALVFILHAIIFMASLGSSEKKFKVYDAQKHEGGVLEQPSIRATILGQSEQQAALSYHVAKEIFREHNKLSKSFDFRKYMSSFCGDTVVELLDTTELTWFLMIVLFALNLGRNHLVDYMNHTDSATETAADNAAADAPASLLALSEMTHSTHISFFQLTMEQTQALLGGHKRSLWTFTIFGWCILFVNLIALFGIRHIIDKLLYSSRMTIGRAEDDPVDEEANLLGHSEEAMRKFLPCGKMKVFRVALELIVMVQCFYLGLLFILNARAAYHYFPPPYGLLFLMVMFVPIAINLFVCFPTQIKSIAFLSAITEVDKHLVHEVNEYQHSMLIDFHHKVKQWLNDSKQSPEAAAKSLFEACKNEQNEVLDKTLYSAFIKEGILFKDDQFFTVFKQIDEDDSGLVDQEEIEHMLSASSKSD